MSLVFRFCFVHFFLSKLTEILRFFSISHRVVPTTLETNWSAIPAINCRRYKNNRTSATFLLRLQQLFHQMQKTNLLQKQDVKICVKDPLNSSANFFFENSSKLSIRGICGYRSKLYVCLCFIIPVHCTLEKNKCHVFLLTVKGVHH